MQIKVRTFVIIIISFILLFPICQTDAEQEGLSAQVKLSKNYAQNGDVIDVTVSLLGYNSNNISIIEACIPIDTSVFSVVTDSVKNLVDAQDSSPIITLGYRQGSNEIYYSYVDVVNPIEMGGDVFTFKLKVISESVNVLKEINLSSLLIADKDMQDIEFSISSSHIYLTKYNFETNKKILSKVHKNTKISEFKESLGEIQVEIFDKENKSIVNEDEFLGTGMQARVYLNGIETVFSICVTGDVNGDGEINVTDLIAIKAHILNKRKLEGTYILAADINNDNEINVTDYIRINADILNKRHIEPY